VIRAPVLALLAGNAVPFSRGEASAIAKTPLDGDVVINRLGISGTSRPIRAFMAGRIRRCITIGWSLCALACAA